VSDEVFQRWAEAGLVAGYPVAEELQRFGEFGRVGGVEGYSGDTMAGFADYAERCMGYRLCMRGVGFIGGSRWWWCETRRRCRICRGSHRLR